MIRRKPIFLIFALTAALAACSAPWKPQRPAWRTQAEHACLAQKRVQPSAYVALANEVDGPGICGLTKPFKVTALQGGAVTFNATATLDCPMVAELDQWLVDVVQPSAHARFGQNIVQINSMGSYACRGMNNQSGAQLSEHSFGNALDIGGFVLADGRQISLVQDWWRGDDQTRAFLMDIHRGSCERFSTVLSPGSNAFHYNHIHVDLAMHGRSGRRICKPEPQETPPPENSPLLAQQAPTRPDDETDNDTTGKPPLAAFDAGSGEDMLGPIATPIAPLPPRRKETIDLSEVTSTIRKKP
jgi:Extensin-like protein C-terminus